MIQTTASLEQLGISSATTAGNIALATNAFGMTAQEATSLQDDLAKTNLEKSIGKIGPNEVKVLEVIQFIEELNKQNKPLPSKSELARLTGVSWPTASKAVDRFKMSKIN